MKSMKRKMMIASVGLVGQALALNFAQVYQQNGSVGPVVCIKPEGGYLLALGEVSAGYPLSLLWLDDTGSIQQAYGYSNLGDAVDLLPVSGGYIVIGNAGTGKYVLRISSTGAVQWAVAHSGLYTITSACETSDGNILVGGLAYPNSRRRPALWKIAGSTGATLWDLYYWNEGTSNDAFDLNGVCDFPQNNAYYAVITRQKPVGLQIYQYPALLEVRPSDGRAVLTYLENAMDTTANITPTGILVVPGKPPEKEMWASWAVGGLPHPSDRYHVRFASLASGSVSVGLLYYSRYYNPLDTRPIKASPDTTSFYLAAMEKVIKLDITGVPQWAVGISGYSAASNLSVATNGDPVFTCLSSPYVYRSLLARLESSNGYVCISSSISLPEYEGLTGRFNPVGEISRYDLGTPTTLSVSRVSISPLLGRVCDPVYDREQETHITHEEQVRVWSVRDRLYVEVTLSSGEPLSISLFDVTGRLQANLWNGYMGPGKHAFTTNLKESGVYVVVVENEKGVVSRMTIFAK